MAKTVKMCDMSKEIAAKVFEMLNGQNVQIREYGPIGTVIITDIEPKDLVYPEGWYYVKGSLRNKPTNTNDTYKEITMLKSNGGVWKETASYCTLE